MTYTIVDVTPDTPEWEQERRNSVGASEVAAVMGLSQWGTALTVYKAKHGAINDIDPLIAWLGHRDEPTIAEWVDRFSGLNVILKPGFMARSVEHPFLHATFDRLIDDTGLLIPAQLKTAHEFMAHKWDEGIPTEYRVQVQAEMCVADAPRALVVVRIGARDFRAIWEPRDDRFIQEHMLPALTEFWGRVQSSTPPPPQTVAEINEVWPSEAREIDLSAEAFDVLERITVLNSDLKVQEAERDALKVALAEYVQSADTLLFEGRKVATWKTQKGRQSFDAALFRTEHPDLAVEYTRQGADFRVLRATKAKDEK